MTMFDNMTKFQLRAACRTAGIRNASKMTNDQMREALTNHAQDNLQPSQMVESDETGKPKNPVIHHGIVNTDVPAGTDSGSEEIEATISPVIRAEHQRVRPWQRVENNTPPRGNRKGRRISSSFRTAGRFRRWSERHPNGETRDKQTLRRA
jgi:hypothetical protein